MNCPHCNTPNDPSHQYCINCGKPLHEPPSPNSTSNQQYSRDQLSAHTFQIIVSLIGLWLINTILTGLSFVEELVIPDLPLSVSLLISLIVLLLVFFLLIRFARAIAAYWPFAFPRLREAGSVINALLTVIILGIAYRIFKPIVLQISRDPEPLMILQIILLLIAVVLVFRAGLFVYHAIPNWYKNLKEDWSV